MTVVVSVIGVLLFVGLWLVADALSVINRALWRLVDEAEKTRKGSKY